MSTDWPSPAKAAAQHLIMYHLPSYRSLDPEETMAIYAKEWKKKT